MCGRFTLTLTIDEIVDDIGIINDSIHWKPEFNITPGQNVLVVTNEFPPSLKIMHWGISRPWIKTKSNEVINIRKETLVEKKTFQSNLENSRCLILADGFYEWDKRSKNLSQPYFFRAINVRLFAFAGLWEEKLVEGQMSSECAILTCLPNAVVKPIHDRMPVMLGKEEQKEWLSIQSSKDGLLSLLNPWAEEKMEKYAVSPRVNNPKINTPECIKPEMPLQQSLDIGFDFKHDDRIK